MVDILKFWIIHNPSGVCLFNQTFEELPGHGVDPDVITGFLYAITNLSYEIAHQNIHFLQLDNLRFVYQKSAHCIMVLVTKNDYQYLQAQNFLHHLKIRFEEEYHQIFEDSFNFNTAPFRSFAKIVESTLELESKYYEILEKRNAKLEPLLRNASNEWSVIQQQIINHSRSTGKWICRSNIKANQEIKQNIISSVKHQRDHHHNKNTEKTKQNKNKWI